MSQPMSGVLTWTEVGGTVEVFTACNKSTVLKLDSLHRYRPGLCQLDTSSSHLKRGSLN